MTTLLDRIRRDQYGPEHAGDAHAQGWNAALRHVESLILGTSIDALAPSAASSAGACLDGVNVRDALVGPVFFCTTCGRNDALAGQDWCRDCARAYVASKEKPKRPAKEYWGGRKDQRRYPRHTISVNKQFYERLTTRKRDGYLQSISALVEAVINRELDAEERSKRAVEQAERAGV
jgi:hypothetical protein